MAEAGAGADRRPRRLLPGIAWLVAGLALLLALAGAAGVSPGAVRDAVRSVPLWAFGAATLLQVAIVSLGALKWKLVLDALDPARRMPLGIAVAATTLGALIGQVLPIQLATPAVRSWVARRRDTSWQRGLGASLIEQLFEVLGLCVCVAVSVALLWSGAGWTVAALVAVASCALVTLAVTPAFRVSGRILDGIASGGVPSRAASAFAAAGSLDWRVSAALTVLSMVRFALMLALNVGLLLLLVPAADPVGLVLVFPLILILASLPFLPAGLGLVELTLTGALAAMGTEVDAAVAASVALRILTVSAFLVTTPAMLLPLAGPKAR